MIFEHPNLLSATVDGNSVSLEILSLQACKVLGEVTLVEDITLQLCCYVETDYQPSHKPQGNRKERTAWSWFLRAIIYGKTELGDAVGQFLSSKGMYLQDPINCDYNVIYQNPHNLSRAEGDTVMTSALGSAPGNVEIERLDVGPDLLARLMEGEIPLAETEAPAGVVTSLCR